MRDLAADGFDVAVACRVLKVSRSGYYEWAKRPPSNRDLEDAYLANTIVAIHADSRLSYGSPRVHAELRLGMGAKVGRKRVARLMRMVQVAGISHRPKKRHRPPAAVHEDLVQRKFVADGPDRLWCTDVTEHPTRGGNVYCCAVLDVFSRLVVGWSIADHMRSDLVVDALQMATWRGRPEGTIVHSDRGSQYTSWVFGHRLRDAGLLGSMGRVASSVDNSMIESFWSTMQRELLDQQQWQTTDELGGAIFEWIEAWYNPSRRHTSLGMLSPSSTKPFTPPPNPRHDHPTNHVRRTGSGSSTEFVDDEWITRSVEPIVPGPASVRQHTRRSPLRMSLAARAPRRMGRTSLASWGRAMMAS